MIVTRPNIAFAVGALSRLLSNPGKKYTDSDYVGSDSRKSTSGYIFQFMGGAISWRSHLQECTALSTTEVEYVAASKALRKPYGCLD